jgi:hypothetical protein
MAMCTMMFSSNLKHVNKSNRAAIPGANNQPPRMNQTNFHSTDHYVSNYHFNLKPRESRLILLDHNEPVYRVLDGQSISYQKDENLCYCIFNKSARFDYDIPAYTTLTDIMKNSQIKSFICVIDLAATSLKIINWNEIEHDKSPQNSQESIDIEPYDPDYPHKIPHKYTEDDDNIDDDEDMCCCVNCAHESYLEECKEEEEEKKKKITENKNGTEQYTPNQNAKRFHEHFDHWDPEYRKKYATQQLAEDVCCCMGCACQAFLEQQKEKNKMYAQQDSVSEINNANSRKIVVL